METGNLAAIDLGTNSCRLRITDIAGNLLYRQAEAVRLGEGMYANQCFTAQAMERTLKFLSQCAEHLKNYRVTHYRAISTASCRMASNGEKFVQMAEELCGIKFDIIDAVEEALLNLRGARLNAAADMPYVLVYDLGGGSTEITLATNENKPKILYTISIPWGARNASEAFGLTEYNQENAEKLRMEIKKYALEFLHGSEFLMYLKQCDCIATSSTALRLMSMVWNTDGYDKDLVDGMSAETVRIDEAINCLQHQTLEELAQNQYIGKNRAPVMVAASVIFKEIYDTLQIKVLTSSLKGAQDAIIEDLRQKWQS
ncbi:MAG: hypothetical protein IJS88_04770 [Alphaproteobacteria bacterium]|nr:hypothetical protein [Alphaproteobacteria bacterium]